MAAAIADHRRTPFFEIPAMSPRLFRLLMNVYPPYWFTGIRVDRVSADFSEVDVSMPLRWYNKNAVGTQFGGSLYSMADPFLMLMTMQQLGTDYVVWDQSAQIDFVAPGRSTVYAKFRMPPAEVERLRRETAAGPALRPEYSVDLCDRDGKVVARVKKTLYVRRKPARSGGA
jgi:acyl-coenzyme A thioesterase PaaI-like protein